MIFDDEASARAAEASLSGAMMAIAPPGVATACRTIRAGDETRLLPQEQRSILTRSTAARRASATARIAARTLLRHEDAAITRGLAGEPIWPSDCRGSLAHDETMAVAAVTTDMRIAALGIDIEPAAPLPADIATLVRLPADDTDGIDPTLADRLLFCAKEAVYKASFPLDREVLGYEHITVDFSSGRGVTARGREARLYWCLAPRIVVLAVI